MSSVLKLSAAALLVQGKVDETTDLALFGKTDSEIQMAMAKKWRKKKGKKGKKHHFLSLAEDDAADKSGDDAGEKSGDDADKGAKDAGADKGAKDTPKQPDLKDYKKSLVDFFKALPDDVPTLKASVLAST